MGFGNAAAERAALERTYEDTCTVTRSVPVTGSDRISRAAFSPVYTDQICALCRTGTDKGGQAAGQNLVEYDAVLFVPPEVVAEPGDRVAVKRFGRDTPSGAPPTTFETVGRPKRYATHSEVQLRERVNA